MSENQCIKKLHEILNEIGIIGQPSLEKCKIIKKRREFEAELKEIDTSNIIFDKRRRGNNDLVKGNDDLNVKQILKEESEINQLVDPLNGSLSIEKLTQTLADSTWKLFQQLEKLGGSEALEVEEYLKNEIERIRNSRIAQINDKRQLLVGVNQYFNPEQTNITWKKDVGTFLGMEYLILEKELIKEGQSKIKN